MRRRATINDIALHAGVSRSTVSQVLRNDGRISQGTRDKVNASMEAIGYTYNRSAANLRAQTSQALGLIINDLTNPFFTELTSAIEGAAHQRGYFVYLVQSGEDPDHQDRLIRSLTEHGVAGIILCPATGSTRTTFDRLYSQQTPVCIAVRPWPDARFDFSGPDNFRAAQLATSRLLALGHRRIAFLGGERGNPSRDDRLAGYFATLQKHGIAFDEALAVESRPSRQSGIHDVNRVLALPDPPTAALCYNDFVAISVMHGLRAHGIEPGQDFALVGFDGMPEGATSYPPLSTVALSPRSIGSHAANLIMSRIEDPTAAPQRWIEAPELIIRSSCGATSTRSRVKDESGAPGRARRGRDA